MFIFEFDQEYNVTHVQLFRVSVYSYNSYKLNGMTFTNIENNFIQKLNVIEYIHAQSSIYAYCYNMHIILHIIIHIMMPIIMHIMIICLLLCK